MRAGCSENYPSVVRSLHWLRILIHDNDCGERFVISGLSLGNPYVGRGAYTLRLTRKEIW